MLGSRTGIRDIKKATNDLRSQSRDIRGAWTTDPAKKLGLLIEDHEARLKEADAARKQAYGWGAKKFIQVAERAEHEAARIEREILVLQSEHPEVTPLVKVGRWERAMQSSEMAVEARARYKRGEISKDERQALLKDSRRQMKRKYQ